MELAKCQKQGCNLCSSKSHLQDKHAQSTHSKILETNKSHEIQIKNFPEYETYVAGD